MPEYVDRYVKIPNGSIQLQRFYLPDGVTVPADGIPDPVSSGQVGGSNTNVQYNNNGSFGGNSSLTYDGSLLFANNCVIGGLFAAASGILDLNSNLSINTESRLLKALDGTTTAVDFSSSSGLGLIKATTYNGDSVVGNGLASVVAKAEATSQSASISTTTLFTPPADGLYDVKVYLRVTATDPTATLNCTIRWSDGTTRSLAVASLASLLTLGYAQGSVFVRANQSTNISYETSFAGSPSTGRYSIFVVAVRIS